MPPSSNFDHAASYLSSASSLSNVSTAVKLELYGLFKCITVSTTPSTSRPSIFDMTGRAKWDAWSSAGKNFTGSEAAERRYLEIARSLGWTEDTLIDKETKDDGPLSHNWEEEGTTSSNTGSIRGMGGAVSSLVPPIEEPDRSIHGLAISNDASALSALLENNPETNPDELDEFGYTPLHLASDRGNLAVVQMLVNKGADTTIKDPDGLIASELAVVAGHEEVQKYLQSSS